MAGNGASLAPATSNPRLACEDNGCLIFSIRRAQCRILSFTRGGASEVISQCHSARTLLLCGGVGGRPRRPGLAAGRGVQLRPLQRGPARPPGCGNPACLLRERPPPAPAPRTEIAHGAACALAAEIPGRRCAVPRMLVSHPVTLPLSFIRTSSASLPLSPGSQRAKGEEGGRGARGMGSLTQSNDLGGVKQMVPLTPAA